MNEVATETNKWDSIALELELSHTEVERIKLEERDTIEDCFRRIFSKWKTKAVPHFTWPVIISALESPSVGEFRLAHQLRREKLQDNSSVHPHNPSQRAEQVDIEPLNKTLCVII